MKKVNIKKSIFVMPLTRESLLEKKILEHLEHNKIIGRKCGVVIKNGVQYVDFHARPYFMYVSEYSYIQKDLKENEIVVALR